MMSSDFKVIGWREWVAIPDLGVHEIKVKVDTGAKTSALHAFNIKEVKVRKKIFVEFILHPIQKSSKEEIFCRAQVVDRRAVTDSGGKKEVRYIIQSQVQLGPIIEKIEISLANRDEMGFRMLLGRSAIQSRFLVDPRASYLMGRPKETQPKDLEKEKV